MTYIKTKLIKNKTCEQICDIIIPFEPYAGRKLGNCPYPYIRELSEITYCTNPEFDKFVKYAKIMMNHFPFKDVKRG